MTRRLAPLVLLLAVAGCAQPTPTAKPAPARGAAKALPPEVEGSPEDAAKQRSRRPGAKP